MGKLPRLSNRRLLALDEETTQIYGAGMDVACFETQSLDAVQKCMDWNPNFQLGWSPFAPRTLRPQEVRASHCMPKLGNKFAHSHLSF